MDQRGCGKSTPHAELEDNNTQVKLHLKTTSLIFPLRLWWVTLRGCGSTLASTPGLSSVAAGAAPSHSAMQSGVAIVDLIFCNKNTFDLSSHPDRARALWLRGIFMCRRSELLFFYQDGASHLFPDKFQPYRFDPV